MCAHRHGQGKQAICREHGHTIPSGLLEVICPDFIGERSGKSVANYAFTSMRPGGLSQYIDKSEVQFIARFEDLRNWWVDAAVSPSLLGFPERPNWRDENEIVVSTGPSNTLPPDYYEPEHEYFVDCAGTEVMARGMRQREDGKSSLFLSSKQPLRDCVLKWCAELGIRETDFAGLRNGIFLAVEIESPRAIRLHPNKLWLRTVTSGSEMSA